MKALLKVIFVLAIVFASTFIIANTTGFLTIDQIKAWFHQLKDQPSLIIFILAVVLLFADLFVTVPTLTICMLSGYFIGFPLGVFACLLGTSLAGLGGYLLSLKYGQKILDLIVKDKKEQGELIKTFNANSTVMVLLSRALPMLPEITACLSGMTKMKFSRFSLIWHLSSVPYVLIACFSGSISTTDNPRPAIIAYIGISSFMWLAWLVYSKRKFANEHTH